MNARERILGKLRAAAPESPPPRPDIDAYYAKLPIAPSAERVEQLKAKLSAVHAEVHVTSAGAWAALTAQLLAGKGVRRLLLNTQDVEARALMAALPDSVETLAFTRSIEEWKAELFETVDAGFTVTASAIAATGTLVLKPDVHTPRTVSLVPSIHVALVHAETIHPDLHTAARVERWAAGLPTNLIMVSGPSKTADIQQVLAYGAHGPKELGVIVVLPQQPAGETS